MARPFSHNSNDTTHFNGSCFIKVTNRALESYGKPPVASRSAAAAASTMVLQQRYREYLTATKEIRLLRRISSVGVGQLWS